MVLVDSSVWISAGRRDGDLATKVALEALLEAYEACWCGVVKLEVVGREVPERRRKLEFFFSTIPYSPITEATWDAAKRLGWKLRDAGVNVPNNDILLAALAVQSICRLYTTDSHFEQIAKVEPGLMLYIPGYGGMYNDGQE
jgi:predicted nucleic acid-binding protein